MSEPRFPKWGIFANWTACAIFFICAYFLKISGALSILAAFIPGSFGLAALIVHNQAIKQHNIDDLRRRIESLRGILSNEQRRLDEHLKSQPNFPRYDALEFDMRYSVRKSQEVLKDLEGKLSTRLENK